MISLLEYNRKVKLQDADYVFESSSELIDMLPVLTPKIQGVWKIILLDIKIVEVKELLDSKRIPEYIECYIYLQKKKLDTILLEFPKYKPKEVTPLDTFKELVIEMNNVLDKKAFWYVYRSVEHDYSSMKEILTRIDNETVNHLITVKDVQSYFSYTKRIYTTQVIEAFLLHRSYRWTYFTQWYNDVGPVIAYNSFKKQVRLLLADKDAYLKNEDTKSNLVKRIDGISIVKLYSLVMNSNNYHQLIGILTRFDNYDLRCL